MATKTTNKPLEIHSEFHNSITKETLQKLHNNKQLSSNYRFSQQQTSEIIEILGGIHQILDICLGSNELQLTNMNKLNTLQQIINNTNQSISLPKIQNNIDIIKKESGIQYEYTFDINDTFLHSILGEINADKIRKIVEHKITIISILITGITWVILLFVFGRTHIIFNIYRIALSCIFWLPWIILKHTLFNKPAFILCLKTFDYWVKVGYMTLWVVSVFFHEHKPENMDIIYVIDQCLFGMFCGFAISFISSFDASNMSKTKKLNICIFLAVMFTYLAITYQFLVSDESDYKIYMPLNNGNIHTISIVSLLSNASKVLCIFLWKQIINTFRRKKKAVTLTIPIIIAWIDSNENNEHKSDETQEEESVEVCVIEEKEEINMVCVAHKRRTYDNESLSIEEMNIDLNACNSDSTRLQF